MGVLVVLELNEENVPIALVHGLPVSRGRIHKHPLEDLGVLPYLRPLPLELGCGQPDRDDDAVRTARPLGNGLEFRRRRHADQAVPPLLRESPKLRQVGLPIVHRRPRPRRKQRDGGDEHHQQRAWSRSAHRGCCFCCRHPAAQQQRVWDRPTRSRAHLEPGGGGRGADLKKVEGGQAALLRGNDNPLESKATHYHRRSETPQSSRSIAMAGRPASALAKRRNESNVFNATCRYWVAD